MRMSCNGCRVLRKGCAENCSIRPCLDWINSPESQSNATLFLAKFYGRTGLINLINAGPDHLRPGIFKSLLYEACGRVVNPVYGLVGLMGTGRWLECEAAVEAVMQGKPIKPISSDAALTSCDIRHVLKEVSSAAGPDRLREVNKCKGQFKKLDPKPKRIPEEHTLLGFGTDSLAVDGSVGRGPSSGVESGEGDSVSVETVEAFPVKRHKGAGSGELDLELTLSFGSLG